VIDATFYSSLSVTDRQPCKRTTGRAFRTCEHKRVNRNLNHAIIGLADAAPHTAKKRL